MNPSHRKAVHELHEHNDAFVAVLKANPEKTNWRSCCAPGCHHCCSEITLATDQEVDYILDQMTPEEREALKPAVAKWFEAAQPHLLKIGLDNPKYGIAWRLLNIPCPLLKADGMCGVYATRPTGCRMFFATGNPDDCATEHRHKQKFAVLDHNPVAGLIIGRFFERIGEDTVADHLALHLYNRLFGKTCVSGVTELLSLDSPLPLPSSAESAERSGPRVPAGEAS